jgi:hypothetical protein
MEIRPVGAELFHEDGRTDTTKLTVAHHNVANASKMKRYGKLETICNAWNITFSGCYPGSYSSCIKLLSSFFFFYQWLFSVVLKG